MEINTSNGQDSFSFGAKSSQIEQNNQPTNLPIAPMESGDKAMTIDSGGKVDIIPKKRKRLEKEASDADESEEAEEDKMLSLADSLNDLCGNPALLMGVFEYFFENVPKDVKIQYKNAGIAISTYYLGKQKKTHVNLLKYLNQKFKPT